MKEISGLEAFCMKTRTKKKLIDYLVFLCIAAGAISMIFPFLWMVSTSLKQEKLVHMFPPQWIPNPVVWRNYIDVWSIAPIFTGLKNSFFVSIISVIVGTFTSSLAAFAFAKMNFPHKQKLFMLLLIIMMTPASVVLIPQYIGFSKVGLVDSLMPLILPSLLGNVGMVFFLRQYMLGLPTELLDAAKIDGCNYFGAYSRIFLPICKPALSANIIIWFMGSWNDYLGPLVYLNSPEKQTIQIVLSSLNTFYASQMNFPIIMAASVITLMPIIIVFIVFQKYFTESFALTGIKG